MFGKGENKTATKMKKLGIKSVTFGERNNIRMIRAEEQIPVRFTFTRPLKKKEKVNVQCYMEEEVYALSKITGIYPISMREEDESRQVMAEAIDSCESAPIYMTFPEELAGASLRITFSLQMAPESEKRRIKMDPILLTAEIEVEVKSSETDKPKIEAVYWCDTKIVEYGQHAVARTSPVYKNETVYLHIHTRGLYGKEVECILNNGQTRIVLLRNNVACEAFTFHDDSHNQIVVNCRQVHENKVEKTAGIAYIPFSAPYLPPPVLSQVYATAGSPKKAHYASVAKCRIDFRPREDYDGSFGFSWYRTEDTILYGGPFSLTYMRTNQNIRCNFCNDNPFSNRDFPGEGIMGKHYETVGQGRTSIDRVVQDGNKSGTGTGVQYAHTGERDNFIPDNSAEMHKKDYANITIEGYNDILREYQVPVMTISQGKTVSLQLILYVKESPKIILFAFDNPVVETGGYLSFRVKEQSIIDPEVCQPVHQPHVHYYLEITCHKVFDRAVHLKAYAIPRIAEAPDKIMVYKKDGRLLPEATEGYPLVLPELCGMLRILPNDEAHWREIKVVFFSVKTNTDGILRKGIENTAVFEEKLGKLNKYLSQAYVKAEGVFEEIDLTRKKADREAYRMACFQYPNNPMYYIKEESYSRLLTPLLRAKIPPKYGDASGYIRIFFLPEGCRSSQADPNAGMHVDGYSLNERNGKSQHMVVCFGGCEETTPTHELLHALGLPHTFDGSSPRAKYTYEDGKTDNLMDYPNPIMVGDLKRISLKSLFEWQWETINQKINR